MFRTWLAPGNITALDLLCWGLWGWARHLHRTLPTSGTLQFSGCEQQCL